MKYTLLCETRSLSLKNKFLDFFCISPQSTNISQYVLNIIAAMELTKANTFQVVPFLSSNAVLMATATIVKKYLRPLIACADSFSSHSRRTHYRTCGIISQVIVGPHNCLNKCNNWMIMIRKLRKVKKTLLLLTAMDSGEFCQVEGQNMTPITLTGSVHMETIKWTRQMKIIR